jgi:hypothetical protein
MPLLNNLASAAALATPDSPAVLPVPLRSADFGAYASGSKRLTLIVKSFEAGSGSADLTVALVDRMSGTRQEVGTYGIFSGGPISEDDPDTYHRFAINLAKAASLFSGTQPTCLDLEVSVEPGSPDARLPRAVLDLESDSSAP